MTGNKQSVDHLLHETRKFTTPIQGNQSYFSSFQDYQKEYRQSLEDPDAYWLDKARLLDWISLPQKGCCYTWDTAARTIHHTWFEDGIINVCYNCIDRHLPLRAHKRAILWQGDTPSEKRVLTYGELHKQVNACAQMLKRHGIAKGDRVCFYMPMVPELAIGMLACARIGAIHSVVFGGFSAESLEHRIQDSTCKLIVTANVAIRGGKEIPLKEIADLAVANCPSIERMIVFKRNETQVAMDPKRDVWWHDEMAEKTPLCPCTPLSAEDPLFILYTSGSTGKPKGVVHTQAGYLLYALLTHRYVFNVHEEDVHWCTADLGWITGHSYVVYGPLANGTTSLMFEGIPTYPDPDRFWSTIEEYQVTIFYTAPTAIRALIGKGCEWPEKHLMPSLRVIGSVGEPINPEAWMWYYTHVGKGRIPLVDTWWQTETGGIMISAIPGAHSLKPGSASHPFLGIDAEIIKDDGSSCQANEGGNLCINRPWPGIMRTTWNAHDKFIDTYFTLFPNRYFSGDGCVVDDEGDYWLLGRIDDVVNVSGHRIGTAEVESAFVSHPAVAEAAVVPIPHPIKGQGLYAFVTLIESAKRDPALKKILGDHIRKTIGPIAVPEEIQFAPLLPKTRSGKIMRRILRKIASLEIDQIGDISTLSDPHIIEELIAQRSQE